ncbi:probable Putative reductase 1 [Saccharomycodes ludwigii]|uniref:Probable Putative reductase 1 n=1 Tax=Saccharomycodes ludwigii TaxID=36035 RepID=A0A376B9N5_9ASCO|nr:hypothetical protein SCDLUD_003217 [Saccharomycodes ludwigii]KAH3900245.1 hypothetical protein SCDLUD_003217 [Saccharomycodes ludwigii]SSD61279.1 probable Putative reductase 1 [Saccharomycodes ludwigii]
MTDKLIKLNTGAEIHAVGLGTWRSTEQEAYNAVLSALKAGYRHIDCAAIYGNEAPVGKAVRDSGVPRNEIFFTTKLWCTQQRTPEKALRESLERLGFDYVDLYLMHWPVALKTSNIPKGSSVLCMPKNPDNPDARDVDLNDWDFRKTWELMQKLPETGLTKAIGVSNFSIKNLEALFASPSFKIVPACNQVELHPLLPQNELIEFCEKKGIVIEAYSPLGSIGSPVLKDKTIIDLAHKYNVEPAQICISWGFSRGYVVLPKSIHEKRIISNTKIVKLEKEDLDKIAQLPKIVGERRYVQPNFVPFPTFE